MTRCTSRDMPEIRYGSLNCNGLGNSIKRDKVLNWLKNKNDDVIFLQETHSVKSTESDWYKNWGPEIYFSHGSSNSQGVAILIKPNSNISVVKHMVLSEGRAQLLEITHNSVKFCLINVYCPNNDDENFLKNIFHETLGRSRDDYRIFGGDWNAVMDDTIDKSGGSSKHSSQKCQKYLNSICNDYGLCDIFRLAKGEDKIFTHFNKKSKTASRLDFFLIDDSLVNFPICFPNASHGFMSDHSYISLYIKGSTNDRGRGYWKLNNSHLDNEDFVNEIRNIIQDTANSSYDSYNGLWDTIKFKIKDFAIKFGAKLKRERNQDKKSLQLEISRIQNSENFMTDDAVRKKLFESEERLNKIINDEVVGIATRARARWVEEGERSTKYFFGLEKYHGKKKEINKLVNSNNEEIFDQNSISDHIVTYYQNVFNTTNPIKNNIDNYMNTLEGNLNRVDNEMADNLDESLSILEFDVVVNNLKLNKSPGWDGLTAEFYIKFWDDIREIYFNSIKESVNSGILSQSQRIGVLTLIPKPKPPDELVFLKNWRPITLLNVDYKIFAHVLKNRFIKAVPSIVNSVQSGFQPGRSTSDNLILMSLVLEDFFEQPDQEGILLQVDFEKAFDSVEHTFLFKTLERLGFGNNLINLVRTAFTGCMCYANVNGHLSAPIYLIRGLHQGSPLSPILFLLIAEVFSTKISSNTKIKGLKVKGIDILLSLFADDTDLFLNGSFSCVKEVMEELKLFGLLSGCKCNTGKTKCILLGSARHNNSLRYLLRTVYGENFLQNDFTALGLDFNNSLPPGEISSLNYRAKIAKANDWVASWSKRDLTLMGKITIIKNMVLSQFPYLAIPLLQPNLETLKAIERLMFNFLWDSKRDKIKRDIICRDKEQGGLGLFFPSDFLSSLKLTLLTKLQDPHFSHYWKDIVLNHLKYPKFPIISIENNLLIQNKGWVHDLVDCYKDWKNRAAFARKSSINWCVWSNERIPPSGSKLWNNNLIKKGVYYISDFLDDTFSLLNYSDFLCKWNLSSADVSSLDYCNIRLAIRAYDCPNNVNRNISCIAENITLRFFDNSTKKREADKVKGKQIRACTSVYHPPTKLTPIVSWKRVLKLTNFRWDAVFSNIYKISSNFKLVQFQYKLLMRISTCKYMRHKMNLAPSNLCSFCHVQLETLEHIFIHCHVTCSFLSHLNRFITTKIHNKYSDSNKYYFITCNHSNSAVNYFNLSAKWYLSRSFQTELLPSWANYTRTLNKLLCGEKQSLISKIREAISWS